MSSGLDLVRCIEEFIRTEFPRAGGHGVRSKMMFYEPEFSHAIALVHGSFESRNMLIDTETLRITGVVDWPCLIGITLCET